MADKQITELPAASGVTDDTLIPAYVPGSSDPAQSLTGEQFKGFAKEGVSAYVEAAQEAAQNALAAAQQAQDAVASVQGAAEEAAAAQAANEAAQAAMQAAKAAQAAAEAAAQSAADDATADVANNMQSYVQAAQAAQKAAETARDQAQAIAGGDFLPLAGGTLTGPLVLAGEPTENLHPATKKYVDDAMAAGKEVFIATYGTTTTAEIYEAVQAGKVVFVYDEVSCCMVPLVYLFEDMEAEFGLIDSSTALYIYCGADEWERSVLQLELSSRKVTSISSKSTNVQYPSAKAVYDAIQTAKPTAIAVTLTAAGWDATAKTQTVAVTGVLADGANQMVDISLADRASSQAWAEADVWCDSAGTDNLAFSCETVPTADINLIVEIKEVTAG